MNTKLYLRDYYQKNKDSRKEKIMCFHCLKKITKQNYNAHLKRCKVLYPKKKVEFKISKDPILNFD